MSELVGDLTARLVADISEFSAKMGEAKAEMTDVADGGSNAFGKLASFGKAALFGLGAIAVGVGVESVKLASTFQESMGQIQSAANITTKQANEIGNAFLSTAGKTEQSANAMAAAYAPVAAQLGSIQGHALTSGQALTVMTAAANLADAKMGSLSDTTSDLSGVMQAFQVPVSQAAKVSDTLYSAANLTGQGLDGISAAMEKARAKMGALAPPISQLGALLVDMTEHGETGRVAMSALGSSLTGLIIPVKALATSTTSVTDSAGKATTSISTSLTQYSSATQQVIAQQRKYGVVFETSQGKLKSFQNIIAQTQPIIKNMGNAQAIATLSALGFGSSSAKLLSIIKAGPAAYEQAQKAVERHNAAQKAAEKQAQTFAGMLHTVESMVEDYGIRIGRVLIPKLETMAKDTAKVIDWLAKEKVIMIALAGIITGVLGAAITAFAVNTLGKLIKNVQAAYNALLKLFGLKGGPQTTAPDLTADAKTAGNDFAAAIDAAGKQFIADAQTAARAVETGAVEAGEEMKTGADASREALETGGDESRDAMETGGDTARDAVETGGETSRDALETGAETARTDIETGAETSGASLESGATAARTDLETGGEATGADLESGATAARTDLESGAEATGADLESGAEAARTDLETGGETASTDMESGAEASRTDLETGGSTAETDMESGAEAARTDLETGGTAVETDAEAGGAGAASALKLGGVAFAAIIANQIAQYVDPKGTKKFDSQASGFLKKTLGTIGDIAHVITTGGKTNTLTGPSFLPVQNTETKYGDSYSAISKTNANGLIQTKDANAAGLLNKATGTINALGPKFGTASGKTTSAVTAASSKAAKSADVTKTTAAVTKASAAAAKDAKTADVAKTTKAASDVNTSVKAVKTAIEKGKPITVQNHQTFTITLDGKQVASAVRTSMLNGSRATGNNVFGNSAGSNKQGSGISR